MSQQSLYPPSRRRSRAGRVRANMQGCATCRIRKKPCPGPRNAENGDMGCSECTRLGLQCLELYRQAVPAQYRHRDVNSCLREWHNLRASRRSGEILNIEILAELLGARNGRALHTIVREARARGAAPANEHAYAPYDIPHTSHGTWNSTLGLTTTAQGHATTSAPNPQPIPQFSFSVDVTPEPAENYGYGYRSYHHTRSSYPPSTSTIFQHPTSNNYAYGSTLAPSHHYASPPYPTQALLQPNQYYQPDSSAWASPAASFTSVVTQSSWGHDGLGGFGSPHPFSSPAFPPAPDDFDDEQLPGGNEWANHHPHPQ